MEPQNRYPARFQALDAAAAGEQDYTKGMLRTVFENKPDFEC